MDKFLRELREALQGEISVQEVNENIDYYKRYFNEQMKLGRSLNDILEELGDPRIIATSIINANKISKRSSYNYNAYSEDKYDNNSTYDNSEYRYSYEEKDGRKGMFRDRFSNNMREYSNGCSGGCSKLALILLFVAIVAVAIIVTLFKGIFMIFKWALIGGAPVVLVLIVILIFVFLRGRR